MYQVLDKIRDLLETNLVDGSSNPLFKKYYVGKIENPALAYLPCLMVYGKETVLDNSKLSTSTDKYIHNIVIEICTSAFNKVNQAEDSNKDLQAQKELYTLMEDRDSNGTPKANTVLGVLRRNIKTSAFLFNNKIRIEYPKPSQK